jgi:hypothetical protein
VLVPLVVSFALAVVGALVVAKVAHVAMRRLDLELVSVLLWLGLAEAPVDELGTRRAAFAPTTQPRFGNRVAGGRTL